MATGQTRLASLSRQTFLAATLPSRLPSKIRLLPPKIRVFCSLPLDPKDTLHLISRNNRAGPIGPRARVSDSELRENWLDSLSCPFPETGLQAFGEGKEVGSGPRPADWVIGIDPDVAGALALLKGNGSDLSAQVFDTPYLQVLVGKRARKRLDTRSIVQMIHSFGAPQGTTAYIEQSHPFPQDGKQGWWSTGFTYGLWIGILVASGFSVVPVSSRLWKDQFELARNSSTKDDSRKAASVLFPSLTCSLKRKKDHGRAEALLIAAYGKGLRLQSDSSTAQEQHTLTPA